MRPDSVYSEEEAIGHKSRPEEHVQLIEGNTGLSAPTATRTLQSGRWGNARRLTLLVVLSFLVRGYVLLRLQPFRPIFDEAEYLERALGFSRLLRSVLRGTGIDEPALLQFYGDGIWPPFHPVVLSLWAAVFGDGAGPARWLQVVLSALTTGLVYLVARRMVGSKSAMSAAGLHLVLPSFVAFSHYLWAETLFLFLLFSLLTVLVSSIGEESRRGQMGKALLVGGLVGLACLTRAAGLPLLLVVPIWMGFRSRSGGRSVVVFLVVFAALLTVAPWQALIVREEGAMLPISAAGGYNLILGNNPFPTKTKRQLKRSIREFARERNLNHDAAARRLAFGEIGRRPEAALGRILIRARTLFLPDQFVLRHAYGTVYRPSSKGPRSLLLFVVIFAHLAFGVLMVLGLGDRLKGRNLLDLCMLMATGAVLLILPTLTVANTRMALPAFALFLPLAGTGLVRLLEAGEVRYRWRRVLVVAGVILALALNAAMPPGGLNTLIPRPSSFYSKPLSRVARMLGAELLLTDCLRLRTASGGRRQLEVVLEGGFRFQSNHREWRRVRVRNRASSIAVYAIAGRGKKEPGPLRLFLRDLETGISTDPVEPVLAESWGVWVESGLPGVEVRWCGMGFGASGR